MVGAITRKIENLRGEKQLLEDLVKEKSSLVGSVLDLQLGNEKIKGEITKVNFCGESVTFSYMTTIGIKEVTIGNGNSLSYSSGEKLIIRIYR